MLGAKLLDPEGVESQIGELEGLGLLEVETTFFPEKITTQASAEVMAGCFYDEMPIISVGGYEIHMGKTRLSNNVKPFAMIIDETGSPIRADGAVSEDGKVWGTYLHGIFDHEEFNAELLSFITDNEKGEPMILRESFLEYKEKQYRILAETVRNSVDMRRIYDILEASGQ